MRRIIHRNESDSLKEEQRKSAEARASANEAAANVQSAGQQLSDLQVRAEDAEARLEQLEIYETESVSHIETLKSEIAAKQTELREVEGKLSSAYTELDVVEGDTQKAIVEHAQLLKKLVDEHKAQMAVYADTQASSRAVLEELDTTIESKTKVLNGLTKVLEAYKREENRMEKEVIPNIKVQKEELDVINNQVLVTKVELKGVEEALYSMRGQYNSEKVLYEEAMANRIAEQEKLQQAQKKFIEREGEVEKKIADLRVLQAGVDQATSRLQRREEEFTLKQHLQTKQDVIEN